MTDNRPPDVKDVLDLLNRWRHLPSYPLEGRSAPYFAVFLRDILSHGLEVGMDKTVIPEFPLRIGTLYDKEERKERWPERGPKPNQSYNVDYVAFSKDNVYLVELKTDLDSKRDSQDKYLRQAQGKEFGCLVQGVKKLANASKSKRKYVHLLHQLSLAGFVYNADDLYEKAFSQSTRAPAWKDVIKNLKIGDHARRNPEVVFIQPTVLEADKGKSKEYGFKYIDFCEAAEAVRPKGDLGKMFADCLVEWTNRAGSKDPRCVTGQ